MTRNVMLGLALFVAVSASADAPTTTFGLDNGRYWLQMVSHDGLEFRRIGWKA